MRLAGPVLVSMAVLASVLTLPAPAAPGPCEASDSQVGIVDSSDSGFSPGTIELPAGGTVCWTNQHLVSHTATADAGGNPNSGNLGPGESYREAFPTDATISYHCAIHPNMRGTVKVGAGGPSSGGGGTGGGGTTGPGVDAAPTFSSVRVVPRRACSRRSRTCRRPGARVRFSISEAARITGALDRRGGLGARVVRRFSFPAGAGVNRVRIPLRRLRPGRYRLALRAVDGAGNRSAPARAGFRLRR